MRIGRLEVPVELTHTKFIGCNIGLLVANENTDFTDVDLSGATVTRVSAGIRNANGLTSITTDKKTKLHPDFARVIADARARAGLEGSYKYPNGYDELHQKFIASSAPVIYLQRREGPTSHPKGEQLKDFFSAVDRGTSVKEAAEKAGIDVEAAERMHKRRTLDHKAVVESIRTTKAAALREHMRGLKPSLKVGA
jgi:hypothetical protein